MVERNGADKVKAGVKGAVDELEIGMEAEKVAEKADSSANDESVKVHFNGSDFEGRAMVGALLSDDGIRLLIGGRVSDKEMCNALTHLLTELHKHKETVLDLALMAFIAEDMQG